MVVIPMDGDWWMNARVAPRWSSDGTTIAYLAPADHGSTPWLIEQNGPDGSNARQSNESGVLRFDWYLDSKRVVYTRNTDDGSGNIEMVATNLSIGEEPVLLEANATELSVAPDGQSVAYNSADGHFSMNRFLLRLELPDTASGLPRPARFAGADHVRQRDLARARRRVDAGQRHDGLYAGLRPG